MLVLFLVLCVIWYDFVGYFEGLGKLRIFSYQLMVIASLLYATSTNKRFHRNALLSVSEGILCLFWGSHSY